MVICYFLSQTQNFGNGPNTGFSFTGIRDVYGVYDILITVLTDSSNIMVFSTACLLEYEILFSVG